MTGNFGMNATKTASLGFDTQPEKSDLNIEQDRLVKYCEDK